MEVVLEVPASPTVRDAITCGRVEMMWREISLTARGLVSGMKCYNMFYTIVTGMAPKLEEESTR